MFCVKLKNLCDIFRVQMSYKGKEETKWTNRISCLRNTMKMCCVSCEDFPEMNSWQKKLTQETIYRAIKSIHMFKGDSDMRVWLCSIAKNLFFTYCKKQKHVTYGEVYENYEAEEKLFMQILEDRETAFQIHKILHELKEPYKENFFCGFSENCPAKK